MREFAKHLCYQGKVRTDAIYWVNRHLKWCKNYRTTPKTIKFNEIVVYIEDLTLQYQCEETVNNIIDKVRLYYEYLLEHKKIKRNLFDNKYLEIEKREIFKHITSLLDVPNRFTK